MAQTIKQPNIFGRLGSGIGQGLAEQIPKEIERNRLASGLQDLAENSANLSHFQRFAKLASIPGITPQAIQSGEQLLRAEGIRNSFSNQKGTPKQFGANEGNSPRDMRSNPGEFTEGIKGIRAGNFSDRNISKSEQQAIQQGETIPSNFPSRTEEANSGKGITKENPTQDKYIPAIPWTPEQRDDDIGRESMLHPELSFDQIQQRVSDNERRYLESPEAFQKQYNYLRGKENEAAQELDSQLQTALQKEGDNIYKDLTGTNILNLKKGMFNDLATDSSLTPKRAAAKWQLIGKDFAETKNLIKEKSSRGLIDRILPSKKEETLKSLMRAQPIFEKMGAQREYYDILRSDFGLTPGGSALISYPRSENVKNIIKNPPPINEFNFKNSSTASRKIADEFAKKRTSSDSILAFAREMKDRHPQFDESAFFDYLDKNRDQFNFSADQEKELVTGVADIFRNWGDHALFPIFGRSKAHE